MQKHGFDMHRVFLSAPGDLEKERDACRSAIGDVNSASAMPAQILLVTVGLNNDDGIVGYRSAVAGNIRESAYYVQVFDDDWGPKNLFRKMFFLAAECRDDPNFPMKDLVVFLKDAPRETDPEILGFRKELQEQPGVHAFAFDNAETLKTQLRQVSTEWIRQLIAGGEN